VIHCKKELFLNTFHPFLCVSYSLQYTIDDALSVYMVPEFEYVYLFLH
jgi:hypothetical protein